MTITVPEDIESSIQAAVLGGHFASVDDAMTEAARLLLSQIPPPEPPAHAAGQDGGASTPVWADVLELTADIPDEEWNKLPVDLAERHDHYIHGSVKRPLS